MYVNNMWIDFIFDSTIYTTLECARHLGACVMSQRSHVLVLVTHTWLYVELVTGLQCQVVVLFLYSQHHPICVCAKTTLYNKDSLSSNFEV